MDNSKIKILLHVGCISFTFKMHMKCRVCVKTNQSCYKSVKNSQIVKKIIKVNTSSNKNENDEGQGQ